MVLCLSDVAGAFRSLSGIALDRTGYYRGAGLRSQSGELRESSDYRASTCSRSRSMARRSSAGRRNLRRATSPRHPSPRRWCTRSISLSSTAKTSGTFPLEQLRRVVGKRRLGIVLSEHADEDGIRRRQRVLSRRRAVPRHRRRIIRNEGAATAGACEPITLF
jgi:hypothetical protein